MAQPFFAATGKPAYVGRLVILAGKKCGQGETEAVVVVPVVRIVPVAVGTAHVVCGVVV
jgi:hypothetical protein